MTAPIPGDAGPEEYMAPRGDVVIVGTCASGKTTLAEELRRLGYPARVVAQEHSDIAGLWRRHGPALVIGLEAPLETVRRRRGSTWSAAVYDRQRQRLRPAMDHAAVIIDTGRASPMATLAAATAALREAGIRPGSADDETPRRLDHAGS